MDWTSVKHEDFTDYWLNEAGGAGTSANLRNSQYSFEQQVDYLKWHMEMKKEDKVLDVGCGNGHTMLHLVGSVKEIIGIDLSPRMLKAAREEVLRLTPGSWVIGEPIDIFKTPLPYEDESFDKVYCLAVFQYAPNINAAKFAIKEMYRVCKPEGKILVGDIFDATHLPPRPGAETFYPADLLLGYDGVAVRSNYEPFRRFDLFINKL